FRTIRFARVEEFHVAAERNRADGVFDAVAPDARPDGFAEPDREPQDLDPETPRDPEMAELVERDQHAERDQQPPRGTEQLAHRKPCSDTRAGPDPPDMTTPD